jgi:hypothetical protein
MRMTVQDCGRMAAMLSAPSVLSQEPPVQDKVDRVNLILVVSAAELFVTSIVLVAAAAWVHGAMVPQLLQTGAVVFGLSLGCLLVAAVLDQVGYESS